MKNHQKYKSPRIKVLQMQDVMGLPSSIPDPGFDVKEMEFEEEIQEIKRTDLWEE